MIFLVNNHTFVLIFTQKSDKMYKKLTIIAASLAAAVSATAGGYVHNSNQNIAYLRNPAQNAVIGVQGAYFNPAGIGFLNNGLYLSVDINTAVQQRISTTTYEPLAYGVDNNGKPYKKYVGKSFVPVLPHLDLAYKHNNWFGSFHFGVISGGGKCDYANGLGSLEAPVALVSAVINRLAGTQIITGYDVDTDLVGEQYNFSGQINLGYKISKNWSVSAGVRINVINNSYNANIKNIQFQYGGTMLPAANVLGGVISTLSGGMVSSEQGAAMAGGLVADKELDAKQSDVAFTPIISVHYKTGKFDFAARYEFNTKVRLKNDTKVNTTGIAQYEDGKEVAADIPANLNIGGTFSPRSNVRLSLGFNYYFDKQSKQYNGDTDLNDKQDYLEHNAYEILGGVEWDVNKLLTLSMGVNSNTFGFGDEARYISDMSFSTSSVSGGLGASIHVTPKISIDLAVYKTFYLNFAKDQADYGGYGEKMCSQLAPMLQGLAAANPGLGAALAGFNAESMKIPGRDEFSRKSIVAGIGVSFAL